MSAALWDTASRELPKMISSSFCALEISTSTPGCMTTLRTIFSPMKFLQAEGRVSRCNNQLGRPSAGADVPDLHLVVARLAVLVHVDVDGEMGVDVAHLVLEALRHSDYQVVDERADCAERGDVLARAVVQLDVDDVLLGQRKVDGQMVQALGELPYLRFPPSVRQLPTVVSRRPFGTSQHLVPRGPSTVTFLALMWTLTVHAEVAASAIATHQPSRTQLAVPQRAETLHTASSVAARSRTRILSRDGQRRGGKIRRTTVRTYRLLEYPASAPSGCTSSWAICGEESVLGVVKPTAKPCLSVIFWGEILCGRGPKKFGTS